LIPTTDVTHDYVAGAVRGRSEFEIVRNGFDEVVARCDFCVTVSGTAALHVAAYGAPMIVVYYGNPVLWNLVGRWIVTTRTYSLVNILSGKQEKIAPEFIPWYGSIGPAANRVIWYLRHPEAMERQSNELLSVVRALDRKGASMNVAKMALEMTAEEQTEGQGASGEGQEGR
jgi:lipid A disaccharide synthetase